MADQQDKSSANVQELAGAVKSGVQFAKAAGQAAAGNVPGAILSVLKDKNIRNAIISVILVVCLMFSCVAMAVGGVLIAIVDTVVQCWNENWESYAADSGGSTLYLYTVGVVGSVFDTAYDSVVSLIDAVGLDFGSHKVDGHDASNAELGGTDISKNDYLNALQAIADRSEIDRQIWKRIDLIKKRVEQRGKQIAAMTQLEALWNGISVVIGESLNAALSDPITFAGIDLENSSITLDTSAFELTDLQALKILAIYCAQHNCGLSEADMWGLMDYCGWYQPLDVIDSKELPLSQAGTIYDMTSSANTYSDLAGLHAGSSISLTKPLPAPSVLPWTGKCAEQWVYDELAQISDYNKADGTSYTFLNYDSLRKYRTFSLIDTLYTSAYATVTITKMNYQGMTSWARDWLLDIREGIDSISAAIVDPELVDAIIDYILETTLGGIPVAVSLDGYAMVLEENGTYYTILFPFTENHLPTDAQNRQLRSATRFWLQASDASGRSDKIDYRGEPVVVTDYVELGQTYDVMCEVPVLVHNKPILVDGEPITETVRIDTITIPQPQKNEDKNKTYTLAVDVEYGFAARSVDELAVLLGLWPGDLTEVTTTDSGMQFANGHIGDPNYLLEWTDQRSETIKGDNPVPVSFRRQDPYQIQSYRDQIRYLAKELGIDVTGAFQPETRPGQTMIDVARQEYAYYTVNNLLGGQRYWSAMASFDQEPYWNAKWDGAFVLTCAAKAGYISADGCFGNFGGGAWPYTPEGIYEAIVEYGSASVHTESDYTPQPGDLIFLGSDGKAERIGIVDGFTEDGRDITFYTISSITNGRTALELRSTMFGNYAPGSGITGGSISTSGFVDPATKNNLDLVAWAKNARAAGWGYVRGTFGQVLTQSLFDAKLAQYPLELSPYADYIATHWVGRRTADCIGLIKGYGWLNAETGQINYRTNGMPDIDENTMFAAATEKGDIDTIPEIPGLAVWKNGHIGIYIGGGQVIQALGTTSGVVQTDIGSTGWTNWFKIPYITYIDPTADSESTTAVAAFTAAAMTPFPGTSEILCYVRLNAPAGYPEDSAAAYAGGPYAVAPGASFRTGIGNDEKFLMAGIPGFRQKDLRNVALMIRNVYPGYNGEELFDAMRSNELEKFVKIWNETANKDPEGFRQVQMQIAADYLIAPIAGAVRKTFDWERTPARQQLLWAICSTSDNRPELEALLADLGDALRHTKNDREIIDAFLNGSLDSVFSRHLPVWGGSPQAEIFIPLIKKAAGALTSSFLQLT